MPSRPTIALTLTVACASLFTLALPAAAAALDAQPADEADAAILADLDHPEFDRREAATRALTDDTSREALERLERLLARDDLSPEQFARLREAAQVIFDARDRAGLGVSFVDQRGTGPVAIRLTIEGFPAHNALKPGDRVIAIDGVDMRTTDHMRWVILSKEPGEVLQMDLLRTDANGEETRLEVPVELGSYDDLDNPLALDPADLRAALDVRLTRLGITAPGADADRTLGRAIEPAEWLAAEGIWPDLLAGDVVFPLADTTRDVTPDAARAAAVGGQPRALDGAEALSAGDLNHRERQINSRLTSRDPRGEWEHTLALVRLGARRIIEIDRRLHSGVGRNRRVASLDGLRREREQLVEGLQNAVRAVEVLELNEP